MKVRPLASYTPCDKKAVVIMPLCLGLYLLKHWAHLPLKDCALQWNGSQSRKCENHVEVHHDRSSTSRAGVEMTNA